MKVFLKRLAIGLVQLGIAFLVIAAAARFSSPVNWFFFQKNQHDRVFYTILEAEKALRTGQKYDILILGSSNCENSIDPRQFSEETGLSVFKFVTGAQTLDMSVVLARYLARRLGAKFVIIDAYPRIGPELTEEGVSRAIMNAPDANSELMHEILAVDPSSLTTDYIWLARAIGTAIKPYDSTSITPDPSAFQMIAPGFTASANDFPAEPAPYSVSRMPHEAVEVLDALHSDLSKSGQQLVVLIPPLQNAQIIVNEPAQFLMIVPTPQPDTCFFDGRHMRMACVNGYTTELTKRFQLLRHTMHAHLGLPRGMTDSVGVQN